MTLGFSRRALSRTASAFIKRNARNSLQTVTRAYTNLSINNQDDMEKVDTTSRLERLRELMRKHDPQIDVYIVPTEDAHASEYIAPCDARRAYICGFDGSAGTAVISDSAAAISTDGRYFNQAEKQIDGNWTLLKQGLPEVPTWQEWTCEHAKEGKRVGVDPTLLTAQNAKALNDRIKRKGGLGLFAINSNLVDEVWAAERPARPSNAVDILDEKFAGKPISEKLEALRATLAKRNSSGFVISMLDEIMWLYNVRGSDIPYNPVFFSYALVTPEEAVLYVDSKKLAPEVLKELEKSLKIKPYEAIFEDSTSLAASKSERKTGKFLVSNKASWALVQALGGEESVEIVRSPVEDAKAIKNEVELEGMRQCHIRDGAALTEYFAWLEEQLAAGAVLDEVQAADKLEEIRSKGEHFVGLSFNTISSTGANAAVIHYHPHAGSCSVIDPTKVYLCDSGAQYYDGTTDTTRTLHFGEPTEMEKKAYTLVLKGHISLSKAVFPKGTNGYALDTLARQYLWNEGLDYRHGTGHGVGSYLNVHEGPIGIGTRVQYSEVPLSVGNVISNEPGYYEDGAFGIRIENIVMVKEVKTNHKFGDKTYLGFEHVTMTPMCKKLTDVSLLSAPEKEWLNAYHAEVYEKTKGFFKEGSTAWKWLERETSPVPI